MADRHLTYRARKGAFRADQRQHPDEYFDYLAEAVANAALLGFDRITNRRERDLAVTSHLNDVYRRVRARRKRARMDLKQPRGWRDTARQFFNL